MNTKRSVILSVVLIFVIACSLGSTPQATQPSVTLPTYTPFPTYTPLPTYTVVAPPVEVSTQAVQPTETQSSPNQPQYNATLIKPNLAYGGTTKYTSNMLYFEGQAGQLATLVLTGENRYQEFSLRDTDNKGLVGCSVKGIRYCQIDNFKLPYSGIFYVLVDRTLIDGYNKYSACVDHPPFPDWCYRGAPYSILLTLQ